MQAECNYNTKYKITRKREDVYRNQDKESLTLKKYLQRTNSAVGSYENARNSLSGVEYKSIFANSQNK